jgi:ferredoxin
LLARPALEADAIINLPKVKTHGQTFLSLAVKNMFGIVPGAHKTQWHLEAGNDPELFARLLLEVCYFKKPVLNIVDGIIAMDGNGPRTGRPFHLGYLIAGPDPTAVDITICQILQTDPLNLPTIRSAQKMNLGFHDPREIIIIGDSPDYFRSKNFRFCRQTLPINVSVIGRIVPLIKGAVNSKPYIDQKICSVCQQCLEICPPEAMSLEILKKDHTEKIAIDLDRCIRCYCCNEVCAEGAISIKEGWIWNFIPNFLK